MATRSRVCLFLVNHTAKTLSFTGSTYLQLRDRLVELDLITEDEEVEVEVIEGHWVIPEDDTPMPLTNFAARPWEDSDAGQSLSGRDDELDMSYENLVLLENVKCVASSAVVSSLSNVIFEGSTQKCSSTRIDELCMICQHEYEGGDQLMLLPCTHNFHHACGSEWLLNYSKLCPLCKHDVTEQF